MPRSKSNTGRKGSKIPPEMAGMAERFRRVYRDRERLWGLTQKQLSARSGVSQSVISEFMNEERPLRESVTAAVVVLLCRALKVDPSFVLIGKGDLIPVTAWEAEETGETVDISEESSPLAPSPAAPPAPSSIPGRKAKTPPGRTSQNPGP